MTKEKVVLFTLSKEEERILNKAYGVLKKLKKEMQLLDNDEKGMLLSHIDILLDNIVNECENISPSTSCYECNTREYDIYKGICKRRMEDEEEKEDEEEDMPF